MNVPMLADASHVAPIAFGPAQTLSTAGHASDSRLPRSRHSP